MFPEGVELFRRIAVGGSEYLSHVEAQQADLVARGHYTAAEAAAMSTPGHFEASWVPRAPGGYPIVLNLGNKAVGWIFFMQFPGQRAVLESLFVYPQYRRQGYARKLVREAIRRAQSEGFTTLEVYAMEREPETMKLWKHLLQMEANTKGEVVFRAAGLSTDPLPAKGWTLPVADAKV